MEKYKINFIFTETIEINDILVNVLNKELSKYFQNGYKSGQLSLPYFSRKEGKIC